MEEYEDVVSPEGKALLLRVRELILKEPQLFDMDFWYSDPESGVWFMRSRVMARAQEVAETGNVIDCGTACCLGGYLALLASPGTLANELEKGIYDEKEIILSIASKALGVPEEIALGLFVVERWPDKLRREYEGAQDDGWHAGMAAAAASAIDLFLANDVDYFDFSPVGGWDDDDEDYYSLENYVEGHDDYYWKVEEPDYADDDWVPW